MASAGEVGPNASVMPGSDQERYQAEMEHIQQQYAYMAQKSLSQQGIAHVYPGFESGGPVDPQQAQLAAIANQQAMYGAYGSPYALNMQQPQASPYSGMPGFPGPQGYNYQMYGQMEPITAPGPCYYDPYGMLNPAACVTPAGLNQKEDGTPTGPKHYKKKKDKKWFGCC